MGFFKAYDMRGTFGVDFDLDVVYRVGRALPQVVGGRRWLVGRDCRETSPQVRDALVRGLADAGAAVTDLGRCTTPMVYFFTAEGDYDGSVMVTASHNPPGDNGLKVSRRGALPVGYESGLREVERLAAADGAKFPVWGEPPPVERVDRTAEYVAWLKAHSAAVNPQGAPALRYAVDCSDGMSSIFAHALFPDAAAFLNDAPDGRFPHHAPNPLKPEAREQLAACVRERGLDCGVIFDGDADRCMFVDGGGAFISPDLLIPVLAETFRAGEPADPPPRVIHDVRTSRGAIAALRAMGCVPVMGKVGHAYAKVLLRETGATCGGELAGHYYFRDFHFCDSGAWAALRVLAAFAAAKRRGLTVAELMRPIAGGWANSGEVNFRVADKEAAIARVLSCAAGLGAETGRETMDGFRLEFAEGWISVRPSNTEPYLRLIVECDSPARLGGWLARLREAIEGEAER